ncbi:MAG: DUF2135 domain-containing protein [Croceitalea sp.]|nr:DUF2135 domain-containing protein [Croceitalea sp.]
MRLKILVPFLLLLIAGLQAQTKRTLSGIVYEDILALENVKVYNLTKEVTTATDIEGKFSIAVETGDKVRFSYVGMRTIEIKIEDVTRILNIEMFPEVTELDEVVVQKKKRLSQDRLRLDYDINEDIVLTGFGLLDTKKAIGFIQVLNNDDFKKNGACVLDLLRLNFTGLSIEGSCAMPGPISVRSGWGRTVIEVDGLERDPHIIPLEQVKRIAVFAGSSFTRKYGAGVGGVIAINTFSGTRFGNKNVDRARLRDNFIEEPDLGNQYLMENQRRSKNQKWISGTVTDGKTPIAKVNVAVENTNNATITNAKGKYKIKASTGDMIKFSYTGLKTISIKVEDVTRILNPIMLPAITELDEVIVESSRRISQKDLEEDYRIRKNIIRTAFGYLDGDRAPGNIRFMPEEDISPIDICILDMLRGHFAMIRVSGNCSTGGSVSMRGSGSINNASAAIFDVDGQIFTDAPVWLSPGNIKRIAILNGLATTTMYGSIGNGGVVVINTVNGIPRGSLLVDRARLKNNFISGKILSKDDVIKNSATYMQELNTATSFIEAKIIYEKYDDQYKSSPYFFLDAYTYFYERWNKQDFADNIIRANYTLFQENAVLLKVLSYQYEAQKRFVKAHGVYKEIFLLRPNYAQSYLDMANSYRDINESKQAASLYARYDYLLNEKYMKKDTIGFGPIIEREYNNLLSINKDEVIDSNSAQNLYVAEEDFKGTRLVFEWNDSEAEFDLQFVNPGNQYYTWRHSLAENAETIYREKDLGYNTAEYLLDGSLPGTWRVNVNYLGNKSLSPTYMKVTVYYNYGSRNQRKDAKVFKLSLKNVNQELFKMQSIGLVASE